MGIGSSNADPGLYREPVLNRLDLTGVARDELAGRLPRPVVDGDEPVDIVREIIASVRHRGDGALRELADRFDGGAPAAFRVSPGQMDAAWERVDPALRGALEEAADSIEAFHVTQRHSGDRHEHRGMVIEGIQQPVRRAGCYVPGGRASYPSTVLMTAVPARVAGVEELCLCVPPAAGGQVADVTLAAARIAGVDEVYAVGGAQAIAAMAYGTESIPAVDVIAGPGNVFVAIAKREVAG